MPFSSGTFTRTFDCTTDRDNGVKILASKFDTELDGFATGLSTTILKDGTQTCTAAIPFAEGLTIPDDKTIVFGTNSDVTIQYDETTNDALEIAANVEGAALGVVLKADQGDDNADSWKLNVADGGTMTVNSKISGSFVSQMTLTPNATVASSTTNVHGILQYASLSDGTITITQFVDEDNMASDSATMVPTQQSVKAYVDSQVTAQDFDFSGDSGGAQSVDLDSQSMTFTGGTGIDTTGSAQTLTVAIDSTVATLSGAQTLTNKSIDATQLTGTVANARLDQQLQDVAGLAVTDGGIIVGDGSNFVLETGATARTSLGLAIGTDVQAYDAQLADVAGLAVTDGNFIVGDGSNFVAESGATARTSLGLGSIATQASNNVSITGGSVAGITDLAIADGGTGASSASAARTNLGLGSAATSNTTDFDPAGEAVALAIALG